MSKIPVGISTCLLGKEVRHDGGHKHSRYCTQVLSRYFDFRSICPELEAGLGVPRPAIHLREYDDGLKLVETKGAEDHTESMQGFIDQVMPTLTDLRGYILMAKSPSCGMERIKVHNADGNVTRRDGRGMFAEALIARLQELGHNMTTADASKFLRTKPGFEAAIRSVSTFGEFVRLFPDTLTLITAARTGGMSRVGLKASERRRLRGKQTDPSRDPPRRRLRFRQAAISDRA